METSHLKHQTLIRTLELLALCLTSSPPGKKMGLEIELWYLHGGGSSVRVNPQQVCASSDVPEYD